MPASKRPRAGDPAPSRQVRTRLSSRLQGLPPTPDNVLSVTDKRSVADSATPSASSVEEKNPAGPANPGVVRKRAQGASLRLPPDSDVLDGFSQLRRDGNLTDEQAFLKLIITYDVAFGHQSELAASRSKSKKRESTGKWMDALAKAERAHWLCRKAAELGRENKYEEAEVSAMRGVNELKERSVST